MHFTYKIRTVGLVPKTFKGCLEDENCKDRIGSKWQEMKVLTMIEVCVCVSERQRARQRETEKGEKHDVYLLET